MEPVDNDISPKIGYWIGSFATYVDKLQQFL